jgi:hypothetical protein
MVRNKKEYMALTDAKNKERFGIGKDKVNADFAIKAKLKKPSCMGGEIKTGKKDR